MKTGALLARARRTLRRALAAEAELVADDAVGADPPVGVQPIASVQPRQQVELSGWIDSVRPEPAGPGRNFQADLSDGTGVVTLIWMGRADIPGIAAGTNLSVTGRVADQGTRMVIHNPVYTIRPDRL